jgi:hypothetical protein
MRPNSILQVSQKEYDAWKANKFSAISLTILNIFLVGKLLVYVVFLPFTPKPIILVHFVFMVSSFLRYENLCSTFSNFKETKETIPEERLWFLKRVTK